MYTVVRLQTELFIFSQRKSTQWLSALCYVSYTEKREGKERRENTDMHKGTLAAESDLVTVGSSLPQREEWTYDTYHIWQGYSVLGNYQSDVKGGFDSWLIPTGESSASIRGLEKQGVWGAEGKRTDCETRCVGSRRGQAVFTFRSHTATKRILNMPLIFHLLVFLCDTSCNRLHFW